MDFALEFCESGARRTVRPFRGRSLTAPVPDFVVIDLETTGLDPSYDAIIEVGAIRCRDYVPVDEFSELVSPGFSVGSFITELTGISDEMLSSARPASAVIPEFFRFVGDDVVVGHNVSFDVNFLYDIAPDLSLPPFSNDFICTMRFARRLFPDFPHHRLQDLVEQFGIDHINPHRALGDCSAALACYNVLRQRMGECDIYDIAPVKHPLKASEIVSTSDSFDPSHVLFGKTCVFTGTLERMTRREAMQLVVDLGGHCADRVTAATNYLILGNNDYCKTIQGGKSSKQKKAEDYILRGFDIEILSEAVFYDLISD